MPSDGEHRRSRTPNLCARWSTAHNAWRWGLRVRIGARRIHIHDWETEAAAKEALAAILAEARRTVYGLPVIQYRPALAELAERHIQRQQTRGEQTRATRVFRALLAALPDGLRVDEISTPKLQVFVERRREEGVCGASINRELNIIGAALHAAPLYFDELRHWPAPKIPRVKAVQSRRQRLITTAEAERLIAWLFLPPPPDTLGRHYRQRAAGHLRVARILQFALLTGMRHAEIIRLRWEDIDLEHQRLRVRGTKTQLRSESVRYIPLTPGMLAVIEAQRQTFSRFPFIFSISGGHNPKTYQILRRACAACDIPYGRFAQNGLTLHDARHTVTTRLVRAGLDYDTIGNITGHTAKELIAHYTHYDEETMARAAAALEAGTVK